MRRCTADSTRVTRWTPCLDSPRVRSASHVVVPRRRGDYPREQEPRAGCGALLSGGCRKSALLQLQHGTPAPLILSPDSRVSPYRVLATVTTTRAAVLPTRVSAGAAVTTAPGVLVHDLSHKWAASVIDTASPECPERLARVQILVAAHAVVGIGCTCAEAVEEELRSVQDPAHTLLSACVLDTQQNYLTVVQHAHRATPGHCATRRLSNVEPSAPRMHVKRKSTHVPRTHRRPRSAHKEERKSGLSRVS
jgi:hypothetical protein